MVQRSFVELPRTFATSCFDLADVGVTYLYHPDLPPGGRPCEGICVRTLMGDISDVCQEKAKDLLQKASPAPTSAILLLVVPLVD